MAVVYKSGGSETVDIPDVRDTPDAPEAVEDEDTSLTSKRMIIAGGFLDIALFSTNCDQLKFAIESRALGTENHFIIVLVLLTLSLVLQALMAVFLFILSATGEKKNFAEKRRLLNHIVMFLVAIVTLVNIAISSFSNKGDIARYCMSMQLDH